MSRKFSQKSQKTKNIKAKLKKIITLVVDFHSSTTSLQSQNFLALVTTLKYFFQSVRKILSGPCNTKREETTLPSYALDIFTPSYEKMSLLLNVHVETSTL